MAKDPYQYFRIEARELIEQLGQGAFELERGGAPSSVVPRLLRVAHTLKGAARVVKQTDIANHAHAIEDVLAPWRDAEEAAPRECIDAVLARVNQMAGLAAALTPGGDGAAPDREPPAETLRTVRADVAEVDALVNGVGETHAQVEGLRLRLSALAQAESLAERLQMQLMRSAGTAPCGRKTQALAEELRRLIGTCVQTSGTSIERLDRELRQVRDVAEQMRLVPAGALFPMLERGARDAAQALGKRVVFEGRGTGVRLDASVLDAVQGALLQLVRNGVAHGIETVGERLAARKPVDGRITVEVLRLGRRVVFRCSDDGAGVDVEAVRRNAQRKGLLGGEQQSLDAQALLRLMLHGGLSTSVGVTEVAGRGIGLDVVREAAERLGGEVGLQTSAGRGTSLELTVPLSLACLEALMLEAGDMVVAIPLDAVRRTLRLAPEQIARTAQGDTIVFEDGVIPHLALSQVLKGGALQRPNGPTTAVVVEGGDRRVAVGIDRLVGTAKLVLHPLPAGVPASPLIAGATLDVRGDPQLVLDPEGLVRQAQGTVAAPPPVPPPRMPVLVIDDSLTTRMLEQSILESAGYEVHAAVSAEEGLEQARRCPYALFLVDVEMPGMDGFTFVERTRADPALRDVPAVLVTSRSSAEDRRRGQDVGASAYIVKSEFAQGEFLDRVRELVSQP